MHISSLKNIYMQLKAIGAVKDTVEFSQDFLGRYPEYYMDGVNKDRMTAPWTVAILLRNLRKLRDAVARRCQPAIDVIITDVERGLAISDRYRYR